MRAPSGGAYDVLTAADPSRDGIARRAARLLSDPSGYGQFVLRLDRRVRAYLLADPATAPARRAALSEPAYLFLSDRQGGFPANSFWLERPDGTLREMRDVAFVDTMVGDRDLSRTAIDGLEPIYAHELGHLILAELAGFGPRQAATGVHFVTVRSDAWVAFREGWGEHFQPMALDHASGGSERGLGGLEAGDSERLWYARFAREQAEGCVICPANLRFLRWQGPGEERMRDAPLRADRFIHQTVLPPALAGDGRSAADARLYRDVMPPTPDGPLKNASQMLSSEGVIATLFYRIASDPRLREAYREPAFYEPFLRPDELPVLRTSGPRRVIPPAENVYLKVFDVLHRSFAWGDWPALAFVSAYARQYPDEAPAVYDVFLDVTRGVTVDRAARIRHAEPGFLPALRDRLVSGAVAIDGAQPRPIWMISPSVTFGMGVFRYFLVPSSPTFDLNAADEADLRAVPSVSASLAGAIVRAREARGGFGAVDDLAEVGGMTPDLLAGFKSMAGRMAALRSRPREVRGGPGWLAGWLVPLLRGTYYAAGAWQAGKALVAAGAAFAAVYWLIGTVLPGSTSATPAVARRRWRRMLRRLAGGMAVAVLPGLVSIAVYSRDILPTPIVMAVAGIGLGIVVLLVSAASRRQRLSDHLASARVIAATVAASGVMGAMY